MYGFMRKIFFKAISSVSLLALTACTPTAFMGAATGTATSFAEERGVGGVISDTDIKARYLYNVLDQRANIYNMIDVVVHGGKLMLTGEVPTNKDHIEAVRIGWSIEGVREIIDELKVGHTDGGFGSYLKDTWISGQFKSKLLLEKDVHSVNYNFHTDNGYVYIIGIALNQQELDKVVYLARGISGVKQVHSYVTVKGQLTYGKGAARTPSSDNYKASFDR